MAGALTGCVAIGTAYAGVLLALVTVFRPKPYAELLSKIFPKK